MLLKSELNCPEFHDTFALKAFYFSSMRTVTFCHDVVNTDGSGNYIGQFRRWLQKGRLFNQELTLSLEHESVRKWIVLTTWSYMNIAL